MKGRSSILWRRNWRAILAMLAAIVVVVPDALLAGENQGRRGTPGRGVDGGVANFSELSGLERKAGVAPRSRVARPHSRPSRALPSVKVGALANVETNEGTSLMRSGEALFTPAADPPSPSPSASFQALLDNGTTYNPDSQGAVGMNHIVTMLGSEMRIQNRSGGQISTVTLDTFWGVIGNSNVYDPRLLYDSFAQRWIACAVAGSGSSWALLIGVSQTGDPTGNWFRHSAAINTGSSTFAESPNLGLSRDWITVQVNHFDTTTALFFSSEIRAFNKANLYAGGAAQFTYFRDNNALTEVNAAVPAVNFDNTFATNFLVANWVGESDGFGYLRLYSISGPVGAEVFRDYGTNGLYVTGAPFGNPPWGDYWPLYENFAPQLGTTSKIYLGDARIQNVVYRNNALWCAHHIYLPAGGPPTRSAVQWWSFTTGGTVLQRGRMDDASNSRFFAYPSIAVNENEDVLVGYSRFAANQYPSANYAFHGFEDAAGVLRADTVLKAGDARFFVDDGDGINRWGDWSATVVDPANDTDLWTLQEFASFQVFTQNGVEDRWGTWWGRVGPPVSLTVTASASTNRVVAGGNVTYSIRLTNNFPTLATGARVADILPQGATFVSAISAQGACSHSGGVVTCSFGDLAGHASATATIVAQLNQSGPATNTISGLANGPDEDNPLDDTVRIITTVDPAADMAVLLALNPGSVVTVSNTLTAVVTVTNRGPSSATQVFMTNRLPAGATYISATSSGQGTCSHSSGVVTCNLGTLTNTASVNVTILCRPNGPGQLTNRADVATASFEPTLSNNSATAMVRANARPTLQSISDRTIFEDAILGPITNTVSDLETTGSNLVVVATSSNQGLVPNGNIAVGIVPGTAGAGRTLTIAPALNAFGSTIITRVVTDGDGASATNSFLLTVQAVNDPPTISSISNVTTNEDTMAGPISFTIGDVETPNSLTLSGTSSLLSLVPNSNIRFGTNGAFRTVTLTPTLNQSGSTTITLTVGDGQTTATSVFLATFNPVNDLPTISDVTNRVVNEDTVIGPVSFTVGDIETTATALVPGRSSSNPVLVPDANITFGGSGNNRSVTITPATNQFGSATITISITDADGGSTNDTFVVTVNPVNDPPTLATLGDLIIDEDAGLQSIGLSNITAGAVNEIQTSIITASSSNPGVVPHPDVAYAGTGSTGTLTFAPVANTNGVATITVTVNDQGASNNILQRFFTVTVREVNDAPSVPDIVDRSTNEDTATGPIPFSASDIDSPLASLTAFGRSSNPALVPDQGIVVSGSAGNWTVNVTPGTNQHGTAIITVFVTDGFATNSDSFILTILPQNDLPTISAIGATTIDEDTATNISFTIGDVETAAGTLNLSASSSVPSLLPSITFGGSGNSRTVNLLPAANQSGSAAVTVTVMDAEGGSNSTVFTVMVREVNDPPTLNPPGDLVVAEDSPQQTVQLTGLGSGAPNEFQNLQVTAVADPPALLSNLQIIHSGASATGTLHFTPAPNSNGVVNITVFVSDGLATSSDSFTVTLTQVNDPPTLSNIGDLSILEDATASIPFTVGDFETPAANLQFQVDSSNLELLDASGISITGTGPNRTLLLTPLADQSGSSTFITLTVADENNEIATVSFELAVEPVNDLPAITGLTNINVAASSPVPAIPFTVSDPETLPSALVVTVTSSNQGLLPNANITVTGSGTLRTLQMTPVPNQLGSTIVQVVVRDGPGAGAASATNSFVLTLLNDPPTLDPIGPATASEDSGPITITLTGITSGSAIEAQTVTVRASSSNPAFLPDPVVSYFSPATTAQLTLSPRPNSNGVVTITVTADDGQPNNNTTTRQFNLTVSPVEDPPSLSALEETAILEDTPGVVQFTVGDIDTLPGDLRLSAASSNTNLVMTNRIVFLGDGADRTATITPEANQHGSAEITIVVRDNGGGAVSNRFTLNVLPVNDAPSIEDIANNNVNEDLQLTIPFKVMDPDDVAGGLMLTASSSAPALLPLSGIQFEGGSSNRTVTLVPTANQSGSVTVTLTVTDSHGLEASDSFVLSVNAVNDPPTLRGLPDIVINEDTSSGPLTVVVGDLDTGVAALTLNGTSSNPGLIPDANVITGGTGVDRTVALSPHPNQSGTTTITLTLSDGNGGTTNAAFNVTVVAVNDPPILNELSNMILTEDAGLQTVSLSGISAGPGESQSLQIVATSSNPTLIPNPTVNHSGSNPTGTLTFTPVANSTGSVVITVTISDGQPSNGSLVRTFTVTVNPANDSPTISDIANQTTDEDTPKVIAFTIDDLDNGAQNLTLSATSTNTTLVPNANIFFHGSGTSRQIVVVPATNQFGSTLITVRVTDGALTNSDAFVLTVFPVNDFPTLNPIALFQTNSAGGNPSYTINLSGISSGAANESQILSVRAISSNPTVLGNLSTNYTSPNPTGTLTLRPGNNVTGSSVVSVIVNDGGGINHSVTQTFLVSIKAAANVLPTISTIATQNLNEDTSSAQLAFSMRDAETTAASLNLQISSSNPGLLPVNNIVVSGGPTNRTLTLTPMPNQTGSAGVTLTVIDAGFGASSMTFNVNVAPVNDPPGIGPISNQAISEDSSGTVINFDVSDVETPAASLVVTATSSVQAVIPNSGVVVGGSGNNRALTLTPAANQSGSTIITVNVSDGILSTNRQFTLTVNPVNDAPTISDVADLTINEDTASGAIGFTVGDGETPVSSLLVIGTSSNTNLVPASGFGFGPTGSGSRTVTITPASNQSGTATIMLTVSDGTSQTSDTFELTVLPVNDAPTLDPIGNRTLTPTGPPQVVSLSGINAGAANENQTLMVTASSSNPALIPHPTVAYASPNATGTLTLAAYPSGTGSATITVTVNDGQAANSTVTRTFTATVDSPPLIAPLANHVLNEDTGSSPILVAVSDSESAAATIAVTVRSSNLGLVPASNLSLTGTGGARTLSLVPVPNQFGFTTITVSALDNAGNLSEMSFLATVAPVNDAPNLAAIGDVSVAQNSGARVVALTGIVPGPNENQGLRLKAVSGNPSLIPDPVVSYASPSANGSLTFTPSAGLSGAVPITVTVMDDGGIERGGINQFSRTFMVMIGSGGNGPTLRIDPAGVNVTISWPTNDAVGWRLVSSAGATDPNGWSAVATAPVVANGRYVVTNATASAMRLYRLCNDCPTIGLPVQPTLAIQRAQGKVHLSWPAAAGNFVIESTATPNLPGSWTVLTQAPTSANGRFTVTLDPVIAHRFYRLRNQ